MPKQWLSLPAIVHAALDVIDRSGLDALSLSAVAEKLGAGPSALYTHVDGLDGLRHLVAVAATENLTASVRDAAIGTAGDNALSAIGVAYRGFASTHPGQFASTLLPPRSENDALATANKHLLDVFVLVFAAMGLDPDDTVLAARSTRSAIHGFLSLEHNTGTTTAHDAEYGHLLETLQRGLQATTDRSTGIRTP